MAGHHAAPRVGPRRARAPGDVAACLVGTSAESSGYGFEQAQAGRWQLRKQVTGADRLAVATALVETLTDLGYPAWVHVRR